MGVAFDSVEPGVKDVCGLAGARTSTKPTSNRPTSRPELYEFILCSAA